jgi:hypothetical protein
MSSDYRIEKQRVPVTVVTVRGAELHGDMYVQMYARHRQGGELPIDVLNAEDPFFPLAIPGDETLLICKDGVAEVNIPGMLRDENALESGARVATVELTLVDGQLRQGQMLVEVAVDRPRVLDFLNRYIENFLTLHNDHGACLVNRRRVMIVRQLD